MAINLKLKSRMALLGDKNDNTHTGVTRLCYWGTAHPLAYRGQ